MIHLAIKATLQHFEVVSLVVLMPFFSLMIHSNTKIVT